MSSPYYNHPFWPSPRAARIAKLMLKKHEAPYSGWTCEQPWSVYWQTRPVKPAGRLTHDKALKLMADCLGLTVHAFLHIKPVDAILRLKLANTEEKAYRILGNVTLPAWWQWGEGRGRMPCCVVCERTCRETTTASAAPAPATQPAPPEPSTVVPVRDPPRRETTASPILAPAPAHDAQLPPEGEAAGAASPAAAPPASGELIETLMEFLKEMNGIVTAGDQRYVTALVQRFKGRVL